MENFNLDTTKMDEKSKKDVLIYYIGYVTINDSKYVKITSVNPLYFIFNKASGYLEEINENKYSTLTPSNDSKEKIKTILRNVE